MSGVRASPGYNPLLALSCTPYSFFEIGFVLDRFVASLPRCGSTRTRMILSILGALVGDDHFVVPRAYPTHWLIVFNSFPITTVLSPSEWDPNPPEFLLI
jgi:hypothetical protein